MQVASVPAVPEPEEEVEEFSVPLPSPTSCELLKETLDEQLERSDEDTLDDCR